MNVGIPAWEHFFRIFCLVSLQCGVSAGEAAAGHPVQAVPV
jgi:hypothetical protein